MRSVSAEPLPTQEHTQHFAKLHLDVIRIAHSPTGMDLIFKALHTYQLGFVPITYTTVD